MLGFEKVSLVSKTVLSPLETEGIGLFPSPLKKLLTSKFRAVHRKRSPVVVLYCVPSGVSQTPPQPNTRLTSVLNCEVSPSHHSAERTPRLGPIRV